MSIGNIREDFDFFGGVLFEQKCGAEGWVDMAGWSGAARGRPEVLEAADVFCADFTKLRLRIDWMERLRGDSTIRFLCMSSLQMSAIGFARCFLKSGPGRSLGERSRRRSEIRVG